MAHLINRFLPMLPILLLGLMVQCRNGEASRQENQGTATGSIGMAVLPDSILRATPFRSNKYLTEENDMWEENGIELSREAIKKLLMANLGYIMPKGFPLDSSDLKTRYLPVTRLYIVGKWHLSDDIDTYIVKNVNLKDENVISFHLMSVKGNSVLDAICVASVAKEYNQFFSGPEYAERMDNQSVRTVSFDWMGEIDSETYYKVEPNGVFKIVDRVQYKHSSEAENNIE
jgi:hypothetical protein